MTEEINQLPKDEQKIKPAQYINIIAGTVILVGTVWIISLLIDFSRHIKTNNAQVEGDLVAVTSRVSGIIKEIRYDAYNAVKLGDTLLLIDEDEFRIKVDQALADLETAMANLLVAEQNVITSQSHEAASVAKLQGNTASLERAEKNFVRYENMFADSAVTRNQFDQVIAQRKTDQAYLEAAEKEVLASRSTADQNRKQVLSARAALKRKEADLAAARLQLSYTVLIAPVDGTVGERTLFRGELVNTNQLLLDIIPENRKWVIANFKETQLKDITSGQPAIIQVDALGGKKFKGKVRNFSPATGARFSMVAPDNSTGNFVKITQRIPVMIDFDASPEEIVKIIPGMNVTVKIKK